ncbi:putative homogentisate 1,2-dioxygenase [Coniella lustricola]|uniref:homogentisate 1,2-dioxygenase n=1 Tax=Coniella lustricola TaxID=2025994 RepID=A0A2T3A476_9PEZI|nr:putative homogentisate 1,2-dioxygenase [Coniella lustricola]
MPAEPPQDERSHHSVVFGYLSQPDENEPYRYQHGFGNHHASEAFPGALPGHGTNLPQNHPYGLFAEHLNGTSFISSRDAASHVWMYRARPSVAHRLIKPCKMGNEVRVESCFLPLNPNVDFTPLTHTWGPPSSQNDASDSVELISFMGSLRTICGHGDPTLKEGLAVHAYNFNVDMTKEAIVNNDGEFLVIPHCGALHLQTEMGHLRVPPGSIAVLPPGIRFKVDRAQPAPSPSASGYILEVFGTHFRLPELGPIGANGLAHSRDFEYPVASFDVDLDTNASLTSGKSRHMSSAIGAGDWTIVTKLAGKFFSYTQPHTPFDVVAWHGRYAPYRYNIAHFSHLVANTDQLDPTAYCVLTAPSKWPGVSLVDFCVFGEKYAVARDTLRIPYHHRTMAAEILGVIKGKYAGSVRKLEAGGLSVEQAYMPHGETYECWNQQSERKLVAEVVSKDSLAFMFHVSSHVGLTKFATERHADIRCKALATSPMYAQHAH